MRTRGRASSVYPRCRARSNSASARIGFDGTAEALEVGVVVGMKKDPIAVAHVGPVRADAPLSFHRSFEPSLELDRLEPGVKEPRRRPFKEPFKELLDRDDGTGHRAGECSRGPTSDRSATTPMVPRGQYPFAR